MEIIASIEGMRRWSETTRHAARTIGFVPTMGALHRGHAELLARSVHDNDMSVMSVFVNPTQFNDPDDFTSYPRTWDDDVELASRCGAEVLFAPGTPEMYPDGFSTSVHPGPLAETMEGLHRPGHFDGVATVVVKLLNIVRPHRAYFGEKDFQQLAVVRAVVGDLDLGVDIVGVDTVRDADGLALSSRNARLAPADRTAATVIHRALLAGRESLRAGATVGDVRGRVAAELAGEPRCRTEYVEVVDGRTLRALPNGGIPSDAGCVPDAVLCVAAWFGDVRLIDNMRLST